MIPKNIFQTHYTKNLPESVLNLISNMKILNKGYNHFLFDDEDIKDFIKDSFGGDVYKSLMMLSSGTAKADLWRYCVLYKHGGIYLDVDAEIYKSLEQLLMDNKSGVLSRERNKNIFVQWCLMFNSNHPILEKSIEICVENIISRKTNDIIKLTGPLVFTEAVNWYCRELDFNIWSTPDQIVNKIFEDKYLDIKIYSTDYDGFCRYKNDYNKDLEEMNIFNDKPVHWTSENKIFI